MTRILKADDPRVATARPIETRPGLPDGEAILNEAHREAESILRAARDEAERLRAEAAVEGRERGLGAVTELLAGARREAARAQHEAEAELRTLAVRIAERILDRELSLSPDAVVGIAAEALRLAGDARGIVLRCHPDDLAALERGKPRLLERCRGAEAASLRPDERVARGGCIVESELGVVDARLSTQLEALERALRRPHP